MTLLRNWIAPLVVAFLAPAPAFAGSVASPNFNIPNRDVVLRCAPLPYEIHCSISRMANPEYSSFCFYIASDGHSYPMKRDYRFGFHNGVISFKVTDGLKISGDLTEDKSGAHSHCTEWRRPE